MNSVFLDPSDEFLTQVVNIGIPKHILGFCFHVSKGGYKIGYELTREEDLLEATNALTSYRGMAGAGRSIKKIGQGVNWPAEKLNIKGTSDNNGQNENFLDGESKMKLKNWKITFKVLSRDVLHFASRHFL